MAAAAEPVFPTPEAATATLYPTWNVFEWDAAEGDVDGDGLPDRVMALHLGHQQGSEKRLVVLAGVAGGGWRLLSASGDYCNPSKFFNLEIRQGSVFVGQVETADANRMASVTLQYRYQPRRQDLELIGTEAVSQVYEGREAGVWRQSTNLLTGLEITRATRAGRERETGRRRLAVEPLKGLSGAGCP